MEHTTTDIEHTTRDMEHKSRSTENGLHTTLTPLFKLFQLVTPSLYKGWDDNSLHREEISSRNETFKLIITILVNLQLFNCIWRDSSLYMLKYLQNFFSCDRFDLIHRLAWSFLFSLIAPNSFYTKN